MVGFFAGWPHHGTRWRDTTLALDAVPRDLGATAAVGGWTLAGLVVARCQAGVLGVPLHVRSCIICNGFHNNPYIHIPLRSWPLGREWEYFSSTRSRTTSTTRTVTILVTITLYGLYFRARHTELPTCAVDSQFVTRKPADALHVHAHSLADSNHSFLRERRGWSRLPEVHAREHNIT